MDTLEAAISMMKPGCYMALVDLKDAYYTVSIDLSHQKYLKFCFEGEYFQYTRLPNGLASAPRIFTKLLKPVYSALRVAGHLSSGYIDDSYAFKVTHFRNAMATLLTPQQCLRV